MKAKLIEALKWLRLMIPIVIRFVPPLAAWSAVIYAIHELILWLVTKL